MASCVCARACVRMWLFGERFWVREYIELRGCECECEFGWVAGWLALLTICLATKNELGLLSAFLPKKTFHHCGGFCFDDPIYV